MARRERPWARCKLSPWTKNRPGPAEVAGVRSVARRWFTSALSIAAGAVLLVAGLGGYALLRAHERLGGAALEAESWELAPASRHDAFTDLVAFQGRLVLAHVSAPSHLGTPRSTVRICSSSDARAWQQLVELRLPGRDIRDPKLALIGRALFLYVLANDSRMALPVETLVASSADGRRWTPFEPVGAPGFLFWRPKSPDGKSWYVAGFAADDAGVRLFRSRDGRTWTQVSVLYAGGNASETEIEFLAEARLLALVRIEAPDALLLGSERNATLLATADPPYTTWQSTRVAADRLDGPLLFSTAGAVFAVARRQPGPRTGLTRLGGLLSRKRTAIFRVVDRAILHVADLPSAGDTSYAGAVVRGDDVLVSYYTSDPDRDYPWLLGMFMPTRIRLARVPIAALLGDPARGAGIEGRRASPGA